MVTGQDGSSLLLVEYHGVVASSFSIFYFKFYPCVKWSVPKSLLMLASARKKSMLLEVVVLCSDKQNDNG